MFDEKARNLRMEEAIKIVKKNAFYNHLSWGFSENIVNMITDPTHKGRKFSFILSTKDFGIGIKGSKSFICLAFKRMMDELYNKTYPSYSFSFILLKESLFRFNISIRPEEIKFIKDQFAEFFSSLKRKINRDLANDRYFLRRDLRNGIFPKIDYFAPRNNPFNRIVSNCIVNYFKYRSVNLKLYTKIFCEIVQKRFPYLMTEQFKLSYGNK